MAERTYLNFEIIMSENQQESNFIFYNTGEGNVTVPLIVDDETVWTSQAKIADIFGTSKQNVSYHLNNIFKESELDEKSVVKEILTTASDGKI